MSAIGAATRVAATYYCRCRFKAEIEFGTQRILFREVSKSRRGALIGRRKLITKNSVMGLHDIHIIKVPCGGKKSLRSV